jgi:hypothetical protein
MRPHFPTRFRNRRPRPPNNRLFLASDPSRTRRGVLQTGAVMQQIGPSYQMGPFFHLYIFHNLLMLSTRRQRSAALLLLSHLRPYFSSSLIASHHPLPRPIAPLLLASRAPLGRNPPPSMLPTSTPATGPPSSSLSLAPSSPRAARGSTTPLSPHSSSTSSSVSSS